MRCVPPQHIEKRDQLAMFTEAIRFCFPYGIILDVRDHIKQLLLLYIYLILMQHQQQSTYSYEELIACGNGELFGESNARLPLPPMLMFDRITHISDEKGMFGKGEVRAELDIKPDLWFFACHFQNDPVMPGCLGLDAMWQLIGFHLGWIGGKGRGRALGGGEIKFTGQVVPDASLVTYQIDFKRVINRKLCMGIADATMSCDDRLIYTAQDLRVGLFTETNHF